MTIHSDQQAAQLLQPDSLHSNPSLSLNTCMVLIKLLNVFVPQFSQLQNGDDNNFYFAELWKGLHVLIQVRHLEQCPETSKI